jgi:peptidoglycan/LPS O-acetylase OafA/YrhL
MIIKTSSLTKKRGGRSTVFDLIRVGAALAVFLFHGRLLAGVAAGGPVAGYGNLGVPIFFTLSGYLVYRPFTRRSVSSQEYFMRRGERIIPAMLAAMVGIGLLLPTGLGWLMVVLWSLIVEVIFYLFLPLFVRLTRHHTMAVTIGLIGPSLLLNQSLGNLQLPQMLLLTPFFAPGWWWAFASGMLLALLERDHPAYLRPRVLLPAVLFFAGLPALFLSRGSDLGISVALVGMTLILMASLREWQPRHGAALAALAADASYPFYLWHAPILAVLAVSGQGYLPLLAAFSFTTIFSLGSVILIERPFRRLRRSEFTGRDSDLSRIPNLV